MKIISLSYEEAGYACSIATSIKKKYDYSTNFFDYIIVDMNTINSILNLRDINKLTENFNYEDQLNDKTKTVKWNNFSKMISYHDLKKNFDNQMLNEFKSKYLRRYYRLINDIYNEKIIFFIRFGKTEYDEIKSFIENIRKINDKLIIYFVNVDYDEKSKETIYYEDIENYIYLNFNIINTKKLNSDDLYFKMLECNWDFVFFKIEEIYKIHK